MPLFSLRFQVLCGIVFAAAAARVALFFQPNINPIAAMALFGGAYFASRWLALLVPLLAMVVSDLVLGIMFLGFSDMIAGRFFVYGAFVLIVVIGFLLRDNVSPLTVGSAAVGSSVLFFVVTNVGSWLTMPMYPLTFEGLIAAYTAAIPFFHLTLVGDLVFVGVLFGGFALVKQKFPELRGRPESVAG